MKRLLVFTFLSFLFFALQAEVANAQSNPTLDEYLKQNYPKAQKAEEGLHYVIEKEGKGANPKVGEYVLVEFEGKTLDGTLFDKSQHDPFIFQLGKRQVIRGWDKGLLLFPVGTKVKMFLAPELAYSKTGAGKLVPPNTPVMFDIHVLKILDDDAYDDYMVQLEERERQRYHQMVKERFDADKKAIHEYCMDKKIKAKRTRSGVSYQVTKKGKGLYPQNGETVSIQYEGYLVDGTVFEKNTDKTPFSFEVGKRKAIAGLDEAILFFNKGSEGYVVIPSKLAYGPMPIEEENINIPAHSVLIFKIKVIDIKETVEKK